MEILCEECEAIVREYRTACFDFWVNASEETRDACRAILKLAGGTEEDVVHVENRLPPFRPSYGKEPEWIGGSTQIRDLIYRKLKHQHDSGHHVNLRSGKSGESELP